MSTPFEPTRRRFVLRAAGTAAMALGGARLLSACGDDGDVASEPAATTEGSTTTTTAATTTTTEVERASVVAMMPFAASLGYMLHLTAKTRGYFDDEQLDVDIQFARGAGQAMQAVLAGQAHLGQVGVLNLIPAVTDQGAEVTSVAMQIQRLLYRLLSKSDAPVATVADLAGKRVGLPSLGGNAEEVLRLVLREAGVDEATVELVPAGFDAAAFGLVEQGQIDAMFTNADIAVILRSQGADVVEADFGETNPLHGQVLAATDEWLGSNRGVVVRYLRAVDRARADLEDEAGLDALIADLAADWDIAALQDPAVAKAIIADYIGLFYAGGEGTFLRHDEDRWTRGLEGFAAIGAVKPGLEPTRFYTNELIEEATAG